MRRVTVKNGSVTLYSGGQFINLVKGLSIVLPDDEAARLDESVYQVEPEGEENGPSQELQYGCADYVIAPKPTRGRKRN